MTTTEIAPSYPAATVERRRPGFGSAFRWELFKLWRQKRARVTLALAAALVGAASAVARSVRTGCLIGTGTGLALGCWLLVATYLAPATPPPFGPGRPINPAADADKERALERDYLRWMAEQDQGERGGFLLLIALPATLCALTSAWGAAWRLKYRHWR